MGHDRNEKVQENFLYFLSYRNWEKDQELLKRSLDYFKDLKENYQVGLSPS